jgi:hypothetical protein
VSIYQQYLALAQQAQELDDQAREGEADQVREALDALWYLLSDAELRELDSKGG